MEPKFYENSDNNHCLQCCVRMAHDTKTSTVIDSQTVDMETSYEHNLWTWTIAGAKFLAEKTGGAQLINEGFDYQEFSEKGTEYLRQFWDNNRFESQKAHASANFEKERDLARKFLNAGGEVRKETLSESRVAELAKNNFIIAQVNHGTLYGTPDFYSHYVLIYDQTADSFEFHDPGLPPKKATIVSKHKFMTAFSNELIAVSKPDWWFDEPQAGEDFLTTVLQWIIKLVSKNKPPA
ncbi:MAG: hypothetical protein Q8P86_03675 [bacterium]|nr:hypothetical protein [bacterium]